MPPATRIDDIGLGHDGFPPTPAIEGSDNVFIGGKSACRLGDNLKEHPGPHKRVWSTGCNSVIINSKPSIRIGDSISCGGLSSMGCGTVLIS